MATRNNNNNSKVRDNSSILDIINEKATNIEVSSNEQAVRRALDHGIRHHSRKEQSLRESTVTILISDAMPRENILETIEENWVLAKQHSSVTYWHDRTNVYCQFESKATKLEFLYAVDNELALEKLTSVIADAAQDGNHFVRKPVRLEIPMVKGNIHSNKVNAILSGLNNTSVKISEVREGKTHGLSKMRSFMFTCNAAGMRVLFDTMNGAIQYNDLQTNVMARLWLRINCRPWQCKMCFALGRHSCQGKLCAQCGGKDHGGKQCTQGTRFCSNCKKPGHRARDHHCPSYINEVVKELNRFDVPLEFLKDEEMRFYMIKQLLIR